FLSRSEWRRRLPSSSSTPLPQIELRPKVEERYTAIDLCASSHQGLPLSHSFSARSASSPHGVDPLPLRPPHAGRRWLPHRSVPPPPAARDGACCHAVLVQPDRCPYPRTLGRGSFFFVVTTRSSPVVALCPLSCVSPSGCTLQPLPRINQSGNRELKLQRSVMRKKRVSTLDI
uniref:Uncharacterized protein n=1 Tax=Triticum urartu TaxID=4572 RepID=A0A8R7P0B5_TRIUA